MFQDLLLFNVADGDTRRFLEEFDRLTAWVDNSLDMYKVRQLNGAPRGRWIYALFTCWSASPTRADAIALPIWSYRPR
jgi:hypothetical protein